MERASPGASSAVASTDGGVPAGLGEPLDEGFFARPVQVVARELIGCALLYGGVGGVIVETEAYDRDDPACHAYVGRTARNGALFGPPGRAYVYRSYGLHNCMNAVAEPDGRAAAALIRALEPRWGVEEMARRRDGRARRELCSGPGKLTAALGVDMADDGAPLTAPPFVVAAPAPGDPELEVGTGPRIGINKAVENPWRFCAVGSPYLSRPL